MKEEEAYLNIFQIEIKPSTILASELSSIAHETINNLHEIIKPLPNASDKRFEELERVMPTLITI